MKRSALLVVACLSSLVACKKNEQGVAAADPDAGVKQEDVKRIIKVARPGMEKCYVDALQRKPSLSGKITILFAVKTDGKVDTTRTGMANAGEPEFAKCVLDLLVKLEFPKPGVATDIELPMDLAKHIDPAILASASAAAALAASASAAPSGSASGAPSGSASAAPSAAPSSSASAKK